MSEFRLKLLNAKPGVCVERARITTDTYRENMDQPLAVRRALMYKNVLESMSIFIEEETLLAGNHASNNRWAPIFPEYAMDWVIDELDEFDKRTGDRFYISEEAKASLKEITPFWKHNTVKDRGLAAMPEGTRVFYDLGIIKAEGNITSGDAHVAVNYKRVLEAGLKEYRERAEQKLSELDLTDYRNLARSYFYKAVLIVIDATRAFAERYAKLAFETANSEKDEKRKAELLEISRILGKVPYEKAESFYEAVQSVWLVHLCLQIESNGHSLSYGRMDQYLNPFYEKDLVSGKISQEASCELLTNLWLKTYTINKIRSWTHTQFSAGSPLYQNVTVGGQLLDKNGNPHDAVNAVTHLILRSVAQARLPQPNLTVRYHRGLSDAFMAECIEVVRLGFGMPAFNSDEVIIPSFTEKGVAKEDAYNYSAIGCVEVAVPGKWGYRPTGMCFLNFPKSLLIALNDGVDPKSDKRLPGSNGIPLPSIKHFRDMQSFDEVMEAWERIIRDFTRQCVIMDSCADTVLEKDTADILCSALCDDCIERGLNLKEGGAVYDFISDLQVGIANLADSLAAIKKCVFEDKAFSASELWDALIADFAGEKNEVIQKILIAAPKYGNDDDYVDSL
ncbi:MAG: formate C-acetyltransferase/glycerol dehydratase family glycyl radical enzyme, partial [Treponema sp.]|nr:formate C-acetyltransferase/glycerol dehydratase family glycyl radical enzyme [Treponema sp.]